MENWLSIDPWCPARIVCGSRSAPTGRGGRKHYIDGDVVNSIPLSRAFELGASTVFVIPYFLYADEESKAFFDGTPSMS